MNEKLSQNLNYKFSNKNSKIVKLPEPNISQNKYTKILILQLK